MIEFILKKKQFTNNAFMRTSNILKIFSLLIILSFLPSCSTMKTPRNNDKYPVSFVREFGVRGVIFPDTVLTWNQNIPSFLIERFCPSYDDIILFEKLFHTTFVDYQSEWKSKPSNRISPERYSRWVRHYYGFYNDKEEKIIWVVFIQLNRDSRKSWRKGPYFQLPGAWQILGNLETGNLLDFQ
jgi:hypothetical protein